MSGRSTKNGNNSGGRGGGRSGRGRGRGRGRKGNPSNNNTTASNNNDRNSPGGRKSGGRGRGRSSGRGGRQNNNNTRAETPPSSAYVPPPRPSETKTKLLNGQKGAESHTVAETDRIRFTQQLMDFREDPETTKLEFPADLTNTERKFLHELAGKLGLTSKSTGKGENRHISVTKRTDTQGMAHAEDGVPVLKLGHKGREALRRHIQQYPPSHTETLESHETGAALLEALTLAANDNDDDMDNNPENRMNQVLHDMVDDDNGQDKQAPQFQRRVKTIDLQKRRQNHARVQRAKQQSSAYHTMKESVRRKLPASAKEQLIVDTVAQNPITIIEGETGSGKSTQVPQFILDHNPECSIVCTQPRRISAMSVAERVNQEQCSGEGLGNMIGYNIRLESKTSPNTQLVFVTPGILLRKLNSDPFLTEYTHIIIDEIHEKDKYTEFLLITLRDLMPQRPELRLILMSATLQINLLVDYFSANDYNNLPEPALVKVEGRTFPVQAFFLEDILRMTGYVDDMGDAADDGGDGTTMTRFKCRKCGKADFPDGIEFGIHEVLCTGAEPEAQVDDDDDDAGDDVAIDWFQDPELDDGDGEMLDYDVNEPMRLEVDDEDEHIVAALATGQAEQDDTNDPTKWDGVSPFQVVNPDSATDNIATKDEELLERYQTMHDDEEVDVYLLLEVLHYILKSSRRDGAILAFLPGWQEISSFKMLLENTAPFSNKSKFLILPLHSGIVAKEQREALRVPPSGVRKIVLSTNIAETSLTIEDVSFVIDSGLAKEKNYDPHLKTSTLQQTWISQASCKQRKGRAGRTKAGVCFHMFSSRRFESMAQFTESELLRTPLEEMCLQSKKLDLAPGGPEDEDGVPAFLAKAMSPPHPKSVTNALNLLVDLGAMLPNTNALTHLGKCLATLSLEPRVGKMVIWSYLLGCSRAVSNMAVGMSYKSPFVLPAPHMRKKADETKVRLSNGSESDQITVLHVLQRRDALSKRSAQDWFNFCRQNFISHSSMQMIADLRKNLSREVTSLGFPAPTVASFHNRHNNDHALWQAAVAAGLYPNVASRRSGETNFKNMTNQKCRVHTSSVNAVKGQPLNSKSTIPKGEVEFVVFGEMVKGSFFFTLNNTTHLASPLPLLLLCGASMSVMPQPGDPNKSLLNVDDWIVFQTDAELASHLVIFRKRLEAAFWRTVANPRMLQAKDGKGLGNTGLSSVERDAIEILGSILQSGHRSIGVR